MRRRRNPEQRDEGGANLPRVIEARNALGEITPSGLVRRMLGRLPALEHNIRAPGEAIATGTSREGQQLGTLLAGAFTLLHDTRLTAARATEIVGRYRVDQTSRPEAGPE